MKILITSDWYAPVINGVVTSVKNLKYEMEKRGHEVRILTLSSKNNSYKNKNVYYIKSYDLGRIYPNARWVLPKKDRIIRELIEWKPDIVHSQCEFMTFSYAVKISERCHCPLLHTYHTIYEDYTHYFSPSKAMGRKAVTYFSRKILHQTDSVIVPTKKVEKILETYEIRKPVTVIPTGIEIEKFRKRVTKQEKKEWKKRLGIREEMQVLAAVGRLAKEKNLEELIEYFARIEDENLALLIVGGGPQKEELEQMAGQMQCADRIFFTGMVLRDEVPLYYQLGDVFVCASDSETQGLTYLEAMASGLPMLCRKDPCLDGVVADGINGFQYDSFEYFKAHLYWMLENEKRKKELGRRSLELAYGYSTVNFGNQAEHLYQKMIEAYKQAEEEIREEKRLRGVAGCIESICCQKRIG